jgi:HK97 family phage major capsid protein
MPYTNIVSRTKVQALIPEDVASAIMGGAIQSSAALSLMARVPMSSNQTRMPVLAALPTAYFVSGDTGLKQTTEESWSNKFLNAEEIAAIVPIPEAVLDDASFDIWGAIRPRLEEAIGRTLDAAIFFGTNKPASWPTDIVTASIAAGNNFSRGTSTAATGGLAEDINQLMGLIEGDGYMVNGFASRTSYRSRLRSARDTTGQRLLDVGEDTIEGQSVQWVMPGLWPTPGTGAAELIAGDWSQAILGVRQDITYKILDQAVIQDQANAIVYNLAQQDMVALRVVARFAWQVPNPINYEQLTEASRYPFGVLRSP